MNSENFSRNLAVLKKRFGYSGDVFDGIPYSELRAEKARNGEFTLLRRIGDDEWIHYHSKYDPVKEVVDQVKQLNFERGNFYVVLGFGLGYGTEQLLKSNTAAGFRVLVVEPDLAVFGMAMYFRDLTGIFSSKKVELFLGQDQNRFYQFCKEYFQLAAIRGIQVLEHPPSYRFYSGYFDTVQSIIHAHLVQTAENLITLMEEGGGYQANTLTSIKEIVKNPGVSVLFNQFKNIPAVIVSAGPSLDKNIHILKKAQGNVIIISVDTAVGPLLHYGVKPHLVVIADPSFENYTHICKYSRDDFFLVAEPMAYPSALEQFSGRLFVASFDDRMMEYIQNFTGQKGKLKAWGSVSTMAFDLAKKMDASPVILVGQDLAFTGGKKYCDRTEHEGRALSSGNSDSRNVKAQRDIFGFSVMVEQQHYTYANFLSKEFEESGILVINATEGGILKSGVKIMSLMEAIYSFAGKELNVVERLNDLYGKAPNSSRLGEFCADLRSVERAMKRTCKICDRGIVYISSIEKRINAMKNLRPAEISRSLSEIQRIKDSIAQEDRVLPFLELAGQKALFTFQRGFQQNLEGRRVDMNFLVDATKLYKNLFTDIHRVFCWIIPFFEKAFDDVSCLRSVKV